MTDILKALELAIESKNWYASLIIALIMPDICSKLEDPDILSTNRRYPAWFDKYRSQSYQKYLTGNDCYALRCSYLHEGIEVTEHQKIKETIDKFSFNGEGSHLISMSNIRAGSRDDNKNILHLSVRQFCTDMIQSVDKWLKDVEGNNEIQKRIKNMLIINDKTKLFGGAISIQ